MSALVTADLHLTSNPRDQYRFAAMEKLAALIKQNKVDTLLLLGDITEEKDHHPATLVNDVVDLVDILSSLCSVIINRGNHDYADSDVPFFHFLRRLSNVSWVNRRKLLEVKGLGSCLFLPHTFDHKRDWEGIEKQFDYNPTWIFAHNTFTGAKTEHGKKLSGIPTTVFPARLKVISGDIHTPQTLGPVTYVGSPYRVDFGDDFDPRVLLLTGGDKMRSIPLPGPQKRLLELAPGYSYEDFPVDAGDVVKVRYKLTEKERERWPEIRNKIRFELQECGCMVYAVQPVLEKAKRTSPVVVSHRIKSDEDTVREYGKQQKLAEPVLETGLELL